MRVEFSSLSLFQDAQEWYLSLGSCLLHKTIAVSSLGLNHTHKELLMSFFIILLEREIKDLKKKENENNTCLQEKDKMFYIALSFRTGTICFSRKISFIAFLAEGDNFQTP